MLFDGCCAVSDAPGGFDVVVRLVVTFERRLIM